MDVSRRRDGTTKEPTLKVTLRRSITPTLMSSNMDSSSPTHQTPAQSWARACVCARVRVCVCTVGAEQGLELSQQSDGGELPQKSSILETVPQFDDEATDQRGQLQSRIRFIIDADLSVSKVNKLSGQGSGVTDPNPRACVCVCVCFLRPDRRRRRGDTAAAAPWRWWGRSPASAGRPWRSWRCRSSWRHTG